MGGREIDFNVNRIIFKASTDGALTTAALLRVIRAQHPELRPCITAVDIHRFAALLGNSDAWPEQQRIAVVNLTIDGPRSITEMQQAFTRVSGQGHRIVAVIDEHNAYYWSRALGRSAYQKLVVFPQTRQQGQASSSAIILSRALRGWFEDEYVSELLRAGDAADHGNFDLPLAALCNKAIKGARAACNGDADQHIEHMVVRLSRNAVPNVRMRRDIGHYEKVVAPATRATLATATELLPGVVMIERRHRSIDMTITKVWLRTRKAARVIIVRETGARRMPILRILTNSFTAPAERIYLTTVLRECGVPTLRAGTPFEICIDPQHLPTILPVLGRAARF